MSTITSLGEVRNPALDHIIERPRLIKLIEEADARIVLLCAPAGYGKTTLARQWAARQAGPVAWFRASRAMGDVGAFAVALDELLDKVTAPTNRDSQRVASIASVNPSPPPLARAVSQIYGHLGQEVLLVLDEWEAAGTEEAESLLAMLVSELRISFLVTARARPPWFTSRLEMYGEGLEIGLEALTMTNEEALAVLSRDPLDAGAKELIETAAGWPAVLGLAAVTKTTDLSGRSKVSETLYDYFATELLAASPPETQDALTLLSVASICTVAGARLVLGNQTDALLEDASERSLVAVDYDGQLSIHPLLRELLLSEVKSRGTAGAAEIAPQLSPLLEGECWTEVLAAAEHVPDPAFATRGLEQGWDSILAAGAGTLERWVTVAESTPMPTPLARHLRAELAFRNSDIDLAFLLAESAAAELHGERAALAHLLAASAAYLGDHGEYCDTHIEFALKLAESREARRDARWLRFLRAIEEESPESLSALRAVRAFLDTSVDSKLRLSTAELHIGLLEDDLGGSLERASVAASVLDMSTDVKIKTSFLNLYSNALAASGRYEDALNVADEEMRLAGEYSLHFVENFAYVGKARAQIGLRRFAQAQRSLGSLDRRLRKKPDPYFQVNYAIQAASLYLSMGDLERARSAVLPEPERTGRPFRGEYLATRAVVLAALGRHTEASFTAEVATRTSRASEVRALIAVSSAISALGQDDQRTAMKCADTLMASGVLNYMVLGVRASTEFGAFLAGRPEYREILLSTLHASNDAAVGAKLGIAIPRSRLRSRCLSARELEIHGLIAQGMTNREIARLLFISESTTKVHVRHILEKLGVRSRAEATRVWQEES